MTPKKYPQNIHTHIFLKTPKNIEIQNNDPSLHIYENIRVGLPPPPPPLPGPDHRLQAIWRHRVGPGTVLICLTIRLHTWWQQLHWLSHKKNF